MVYFKHKASEPAKPLFLLSQESTRVQAVIKSLLIESYIIAILLVVLANPIWAGVDSAETATSPRESGKASDSSLLTLERIFSSDEFEAEKFGPVRWLKDGTGYTTLEDSKSQEGGKDIVRYDPES